MSYREAYESWLSNPYFDEDTKEELRSIANDEKEIEDRLYTQFVRRHRDWQIILSK